MAYSRRRKIHKKRKPRGGTVRHKSISPLTDYDSSIDVDELAVKKTVGYQSPKIKSRHSVSNNHCAERIHEEQQLCKDSIKNAMKFASDQCDTEIKLALQKHKPKSLPKKKKNVRKHRLPWRP